MTKFHIFSTASCLRVICSPEEDSAYWWPHRSIHRWIDSRCKTSVVSNNTVIIELCSKRSLFQVLLTIVRVLWLVKPQLEIICSVHILKLFHKGNKTYFFVSLPVKYTGCWENMRKVFLFSFFFNFFLIFFFDIFSIFLIFFNIF